MEQCDYKPVRQIFLHYNLMLYDNESCNYCYFFMNKDYFKLFQLNYLGSKDRPSDSIYHHYTFTF